VERILGETSSWPLLPIHGGKPLPSDHTEFVFEDPIASIHDHVISEVFHPRVFAYAPKTPNGRAALVLAGGGYTKLVIGKEGVEIAEWLASLGFHAFVLAHRFPCARFGPQAPVDDAIEAMRQIRFRAKEFSIDPRGIGVCGLSSGGHLAACLVSQYPKEWRPPASPHAHIDAAPNFLIIGYAPISTNATGRAVLPDKPPLPPPEKQALYEAMQPDVQLIDSAPPTFIVYAENDAVVPVENVHRLHKALTEKDVKAELHVFADAPHGFALREHDLPVGKWPELCEAWLARIHVA
jgi:acetyl esterase/lipase